MALAGKCRVSLIEHIGRNVLAAVLAAFIFSACSAKGDDISDVSTPQAPSVERSVGFDGDIVRLGVIANLTGRGATLDRARLTGISAYWSDINMGGGLGERYAVELVIIDHRGDPQVAAEIIPELLNEVVALAFVNETAMGAAHPFLVADQVLGVAPTSTLDWESDPRFLTHSPPVEAIVLSLFERAPSARWCVITDGSPLGVSIEAAAPEAAGVAGMQRVTLIDISEDLTAAISAAACEQVLVEAATEFQEEILASVPAGRTVFRQAALMGVSDRRDDVEFAYIDSGPAWNVDSSTGMRRFLASMLRHAPDTEPETRIREGYVSQIRLHALLEQAVKLGDLRRTNVFELGQSHQIINMSGLAEDIDMSANPPVFPRSATLWVANDDDEQIESDGRGWSPIGLLRPDKFLTLASELRD